MTSISSVLRNAQFTFITLSLTVSVSRRAALMREEWTSWKRWACYFMNSACAIHYFRLSHAFCSQLQGYLLHTKTTGPDMTSKWHEMCLRKGTGSKGPKNPCKVGMPSSDELLGEYESNSSSGVNNTQYSAAFQSNCYRHSRVISEWVPKLDEALQSLVEDSKIN